MISMLLKRNCEHNTLLVILNWPTVNDCWKAIKAIGLQREYQHLFWETCGNFEDRGLIVTLDNKVNSNTATIEDFVDLCIDLGEIEYTIEDVQESDEGFRSILLNAIKEFDDDDDSYTYQTNNHDYFSKLLEVENAWTKWREKSQNVVVYYIDYDS